MLLGIGDGIPGIEQNQDTGNDVGIQVAVFAFQQDHVETDIGMDNEGQGNKGIEHSRDQGNISVLVVDKQIYGDH